MLDRITLSGALAFAVLGCRTAEHEQSTAASSEPYVVVRDALVFDGVAVRPGTSVVIYDGRIVSVGGEEALPDDPDRVEVVDGTGCTLLPGLIDAHTHIRNERQLAQALVFGVTTELDMMTFLPPGRAIELRRELDAGAHDDLADFRMAVAPVTCPSGLGTRFNPDTPTLADAADAQAFVDALLAEGADYVKIMYEDGWVFGGNMPNLGPEELAETVFAAHERDTLAVVHVTSMRRAREVVAADADGIVHVFADEPPDERMCANAAERGMFLIGTLTTVQGGFEGPSGAGLALDERFRPYLPDEAAENLNQVSSLNMRERASFATALETVRRLHEAGVTVLAGTDVPNPGTAHGASMHRELELLVDAGLTPLEALAAATSRPAACFGLDDRGRIAPGLRADLLLVRGDPLDDIRATRDIVAVFKRGVRVDREAFRASLAADDG